MRLGVVLLTALLAASIGGCGLFDSDSPDGAVEDFFAAVADGDIDGAAGLTDWPEGARSALQQANDALQVESVASEVTSSRTTSDGSGATATYQLTWQLADEREWRYETKAELVASDDGWVVHWSPTVLHPELAAEQTLAVHETPAELAPVVSSDGSELLTPGNVISIRLHPDQAEEDGDLDEVVAALADALGQFDSSITEESISAGVGEAEEKGDGAYTVAVLREPDYESVRVEIDPLAGVTLTTQHRLLAPKSGFGAQVLPAVRALVEDRVAGKAGWRVVLLDSGGSLLTELHAEDPQPSDAVELTLSHAAQQAAEDAVADVDQPAAVVALDIPSGGILAVGQNDAANSEGAIGLTGRYPPGSTFKIATVLAGLAEGEIEPDSRVQCPGTTVIDGREIPNYDEFELGEVSLTQAFARSCNTTFAMLAADLPDDALTKAGTDVGIGADFDIPGLTTITGSAPPSENRVQRAENGFGQGHVVASPFGMALAAATIAAGETPVPSLVVGDETEVIELGEPIADEHADAVRSMMRKVVTDGTARTLADLDDVHGKTGTAQYGDGSRSHGWFAGYSGDVAFAVLVVGADASRPAVDVAHRFLSEFD